MISALISSARRVAAVSVEKYGLEVPAAKITMRPFSRCRMARRRIYGSATWRISMALITRVETPACSSASESARELMTVASMPMWSAVTRSIFCAAAATPRKILPPPTTTAISMPAAATSATSRAKPLTFSESMPNDAAPANTSPLSFSRMRLRADFLRQARFFAARFHGRHIAHFEADEARNGDVLAQFGDLGFDQLTDRQGGFLHERLFQQADFLVEFAQADRKSTRLNSSHLGISY